VNQGLQRWGLLGLIGAGKTFAREILQSRGIATLDADQAARAAVDPATLRGRESLSRIVGHFGDSVLNVDGTLNRPLMRDWISRDEAARLWMEQTLHPVILDVLNEMIDQLKKSGASKVVVEGSRLVESGFSKSLHGLILVTASDSIRLRRVMERDGVTEEQVRAIFQIQNEKAWRAKATVIWTNDGSQEDLVSQIEEWIRRV
jgi:dephospho-CoA kinase